MSEAQMVWCVICIEEDGDVMHVFSTQERADG